MPEIRIRAVTVLLALGAIAPAVVGVLYIADTGANLPGFLPGHLAP